MMKKRLAVGLAAVMMMGLTACSGGGTAGGTSAPASAASQQSQEEKTEGEKTEAEKTEASEELDGEIKFGVSCAITGNFPLAGQRTKEGIDLALEQINANGGVLGKKLVYVAEDDQNTQTTAVNVVTRLLNEDVCAVIGPHTSGNAAATSDLYKNAGIPFMTGGSSPKLATLDNPYFFRVRPSDTI